MSLDKFEQEKAKLLRMAAALESARSPADFCGRLMADVGAPYQSFDPLAVAAAVENMGSRMAVLMSEDLENEVRP